MDTSQCEPLYHNGVWSWAWSTPPLTMKCELPLQIYVHLPGGAKSNEGVSYPTREEAVAALEKAVASAGAAAAGLN